MLLAAAVLETQLHAAAAPKVGQDKRSCRQESHLLRVERDKRSCSHQDPTGSTRSHLIGKIDEGKQTERGFPVIVSFNFPFDTTRK